MYTTPAPIHVDKIKCPHCPAKVQYDKLSEHIAHCILNKPFKCEICTQQFASVTGLNIHKSKMHTAEERQTKYKCRFCEHGSDDPNALAAHESIHEECGGRGFRNRSRSRSRVPTFALDASTAATEGLNTTPRVHSQSRSISRSYAAPNIRVAQPAQVTRSRSRSRVEPAIPVPVPAGAEENENNNSWTNQHPATPEQAMVPELDNVLMDNTNEDYSLRIMEQHKAGLMAQLQQCREQNRRLREICVQNGIQLKDHDPIEEKICDAMKKVDTMLEMDDDE